MGLPRRKLGAMLMLLCGSDQCLIRWYNQHLLLKVVPEIFPSVACQTCAAGGDGDCERLCWSESYQEVYPLYSVMDPWGCRT